MIVVEFRHTPLSRNGAGEYARAKSPSRRPSEAQNWKIKKLCAADGRDADALIPTMRTVVEASGIIGQRLAETEARRFVRSDQATDEENIEEANR